MSDRREHGHDRDSRHEPVGDRRRLEERLAHEDERLAEEGRARPERVGADGKAQELGGDLTPALNPSDGIDASERDEQRQRREHGDGGRHDHDERARLARRHLREPGDAFLDHVPLQPVEAGERRREQTSARLEAPARGDGCVELGADAVVYGTLRDRDASSRGTSQSQ